MQFWFQKPIQNLGYLGPPIWSKWLKCPEMDKNAKPTPQGVPALGSTPPDFPKCINQQGGAKLFGLTFFRPLTRAKVTQSLRTPQSYLGRGLAVVQSSPWDLGFTILCAAIYYFILHIWHLCECFHTHHPPVWRTVWECRPDTRETCNTCVVFSLWEIFSLFLGEVVQDFVFHFYPSTRLLLNNLGGWGRLAPWVVNAKKSSKMPSCQVVRWTKAFQYFISMGGKQHLITNCFQEKWSTGLSTAQNKFAGGGESQGLVRRLNPIAG